MTFWDDQTEDRPGAFPMRNPRYPWMGDPRYQMCGCGHSRFEHYCFGGSCMTGEPTYFRESHCPEFRFARYRAAAVPVIVR